MIRRVASATTDSLPLKPDSSSWNLFAMANSYTSLLFHVIFSTKGREGWLSDSIRERLWPCIGGIAKANGFHCLRAGGVSDHVHLLLSLSASMPIAKAVQLIKGGSSLWLHETMPRESRSWQDGYGAFTVSRSMADEIHAYIESQAKHHERMSFQEEYRAFLKRHGVVTDERYVWG